MGKDLDINKIQNYIQDLSKPLHPIQSEIISYNENLCDIKKMQIAVSQCLFLELITKISKAKKILEIGTFTGLSTLSMALGLPEDGILIAIDKNPQTNLKAKNFFKKANQDKKIKTIVNSGLEAIEKLKKKDDLIFDIIFIDADKENYKSYFNNVIGMIKPGGLIIIDNVLWHGEVADNDNNEKFTKIIRDFNNYVKNDERVEQIILPIGDGLTICSKL